MSGPSYIHLLILRAAALAPSRHLSTDARATSTYGGQDANVSGIQDALSANSLAKHSVKHAFDVISGNDNCKLVSNVLTPHGIEAAISQRHVSSRLKQSNNGIGSYHSQRNMRDQGFLVLSSSPAPCAMIDLMNIHLEFKLGVRMTRKRHY